MLKEPSKKQSGYRRYDWSNPREARRKNNPKTVSIWNEVDVYFIYDDGTDEEYLGSEVRYRGVSKKRLCIGGPLDGQVLAEVDIDQSQYRYYSTRYYYDPKSHGTKPNPMFKRIYIFNDLLKIPTP